MSHASDEQLLAETMRGDEQAFRLLYRRHTPAMYAVALRLLGRRRADAEDAVQEAWLRAVRGAAGFRAESALRTWLVGIAIRCALEITRRRAALPLDDVQHTLAIPPSIPRIDLEDAIAALAEGYRQVLILYDIEGYTHAEIATLLGIEEGTSKSQLSRARSAVRRWLARECAHEF